MMITPAGQRVHYRDHGGDGPPVVVLHSFLMDLSMWDRQVDAFRDGFRIIAVDERGHGETPADGPFGYWDVARDVLHLLDHLGVERAAVVGTSQGGFVALRMALLAPERVTALAVLGTSGEAEDPQVAEGYRQLAGIWAAQGPDSVIDAVAAICLGETDASAWTPKWRAVRGERFERIVGALVDRDGVLDRAGEITVPVLVLHGTADLAYPVARAEALVAALPKAEPLVTIDGGAHFLSVTNPDDVYPHLREFLDAHADGK